MKLKQLAAVMMSVAMTTGMIPATAMASGGDSTTGYKYVTMNVPWTDFFESYNLTDSAVWEVEPGVDAVSTATKSKFLGTNGLAKGTYNNGKYIMGVTVPVAVPAEDYKDLKENNEKLNANDKYYFVDLPEKPTVCSVMTVSGDDYSFSKLPEANISTNYLEVVGIDVNGQNTAEVTSKFGDYQISLQGVHTGGNGIVGIQTGEDEYVEDYTIYGAILKTDTSSYGMTTLENIWFGARYPYAEIAWSIVEGSQKTNHGGNLFYQFENMNGATIQSVSLLTNLGVVEISCDLELPKYYEGDLSELTMSMTNDKKLLNISGIPEDLENVTISVSGGLAANVVVTDGKVQLNDYPEDGTNYTVTISSSNYPDITRTVSTPISEQQKEILKNWINRARSLDETVYEGDTTLKEHVVEAEEMIRNSNNTSAEAEELIEELMLLVKNHYPEASATATLTGSILSVSLDGAELEELENPAYELSYRSGHSSKVLEEGSLESLSFALSNAPTVGTQYTLTIVSDNYQDITTSVTAEEMENEKPSEEGTTQTTPSTQTPAAGQTPTASSQMPASSSSTKKVELKKTKAKLKSVKKKSMKVTWKKVADAEGYQIQYSLNKKFKSRKKYNTIIKTVSAKKASVTIKKLKSKKKYYVRVRSFNGNTYSAWSKVVKKTIK